MNSTIQKTILVIVGIGVAFVAVSFLGVLGFALAVVPMFMIFIPSAKGGEVSSGEGVVVRLGEIILATIITGILGVGFFCGGIIAAMNANSNSYGIAFVVWVVGIIVWVFVMRGIFYKKKSSKNLEPYPVVFPIVNKYQKAVVDYIVQARAANLTDHAITANLLGAGWIEKDVNFGFEAVGGVK